MSDRERVVLTVPDNVAALILYMALGSIVLLVTGAVLGLDSVLVGGVALNGATLALALIYEWRRS